MSKTLGVVLTLKERKQLWRSKVPFWTVLRVLHTKSRNGYQACRKGYQAINVKRWWTRLQTLAIALPKQYSILSYFLPFFILSGYQSEVYSIVTIMTIVQKYQNRCKKSGFFLSRLHVGRDSGFSIKIRVLQTKSGWLDSMSLFLPLLLFVCFSLYINTTCVCEVFFLRDCLIQTPR